MNGTYSHFFIGSIPLADVLHKNDLDSSKPDAVGGANSNGARSKSFAMITASLSSDIDEKTFVPLFLLFLCRAILKCEMLLSIKLRVVESDSYLCKDNYFIVKHQILSESFDATEEVGVVEKEEALVAGFVACLEGVEVGGEEGRDDARLVAVRHGTVGGAVAEPGVPSGDGLAVPA